MSSLSTQEKESIINQAMLFIENGEMDKANEIMKRVPMQPVLANELKKAVGVDKLVERGFNLSDAEATYGTNWTKS